MHPNSLVQNGELFPTTSYAEVALVTGVALGTVMSRLSRARARLQVMLDAPNRVMTEKAAQQPAAPRVPALHRLK